VSAGAWHHVAAVYDGSHIMLYVDGTPGNPIACSGPVSAMFTNSFVTFGSENGRVSCSSCTNRYFNGLIDEITLYTRALSGDEIQFIYSASSGGKCRTLMITASPVSQAVCQGSAVTFTAAAIGDTSLSYQWTFNGAAIYWANASTYSLGSAQTGDAGTYAVIASDGSGSTTSSNAVLTVSIPAAITTQPANQTVAQGSNATFTVTATGTTPAYQWTFNGTPIAGATTSSLIRTNAQAGDSGTYAVSVSNTCGTATSTNAVLYVNPPLPFFVISSDQLLNTWSFSDGTTWTNDWGYPPIRYTNIVNVAGGGNGNALLLDTSDTSPAYLVFNTVESDGTTNICFGNGSISWWFKPDWSSTSQGGSGPGAWARFVDIGTHTNNSDWWSVYLSSNGCSVIFAAQASGGSPATFLTAAVGFTSNAWCNLVLTYSPTNTAFFVNGVLITNGTGITIVPGATARANGFAIGAQLDGYAQARGMFDDLATYNYPLSQNEISANYNVFGIAYSGGGFMPLITSGSSSPGTNGSNFDVVMGAGNLTWIGTATNCATGTAPRIANVSAQVIAGTNGSTNLTFSILGGYANAIYDVFGTAALAGHSITNSQWTWQGQGTNCGTYTLANLTDSAVFLVLGTPLDSDGDGLTDAYELLVSKTNPQNAYTLDSLIPDGWFVLSKLNTLTSGIGSLDDDGDGLLNRQEYLWGSDPRQSEGFSIWVGSPGSAGIP
jgi:hypothetical protein